MESQSTKTYASVEELLEGLGTSKSFIRSFKKRVAKRRVADSLAIARCKAGLTEKQLAKRIGKSKKWVQETEFMHEDELTVKRMRQYAEGLGGSLAIKIITADN